MRLLSEDEVLRIGATNMEDENVHMYSTRMANEQGEVIRIEVYTPGDIARARELLAEIMTKDVRSLTATVSIKGANLLSALRKVD
jgi:hypothetical protein